MKKTNRLQTPTYSYKQFRTEEKKIYKRLVLLIGVVVVTLAAIWFWGTTFIQIIGTVGNQGSITELNSGLNIPLLKPVIYSLPDFTNNEKITISGFATSKSKVVLFINGLKIGETTADDSGNFTFVGVGLREGLNFVKLVAKLGGEQSEKETSLVTLDKKVPTLQITKPKDGEIITKTKSIIVKGSTEPESKVFVNSIQTTLDKSGNFTYVLGVSPGKNTIKIKATDKAGNSEEIELSVIIQE